MHLLKPTPRLRFDIMDAIFDITGSFLVTMDTADRGFWDGSAALASAMLDLKTGKS